MTEEDIKKLRPDFVRVWRSMGAKPMEALASVYGPRHLPSIQEVIMLASLGDVAAQDTCEKIGLLRRRAA